MPIPPASTEVNGIGNEDVADAPALRDKIWDIKGTAARMAEALEAAGKEVWKA